MNNKFNGLNVEEKDNIIKDKVLKFDDLKFDEKLDIFKLSDIKEFLKRRFVRDVKKFLELDFRKMVRFLL